MNNRLTQSAFLVFALTLGQFDAVAQKGPEITIPFDSTTSQYSYLGTVTVESLSDSALYENARSWLATKNGSTQFDDDVKYSKLVDKGTFSVQATFSMGLAKGFSTVPISYMIALDFKSGRYRYNIYRFRLYGDESSTTPTQSLEDFVKGHESRSMGRKANIRYEEDVCSAIDDEVMKLIQDMKVQLLKEPAKDW